MPLLFSTVSSRALNYDTALKDLSNPRVFTELQLRCICLLRMRCCFVQRSLRFYTEFFGAVNKFKKILFAGSHSILVASSSSNNLKAVLFNRAKDYSTVFDPCSNFFTRPDRVLIMQPLCRGYQYKMHSWLSVMSHYWTTRSSP